MSATIEVTREDEGDMKSTFRGGRVEMAAGRDLDARVVREVFGWVHVHQRQRDGWVGWMDEDHYQRLGSISWPVPPYSTCIAAAWEVVEALETRRILSSIVRKLVRADDWVYEVEFRLCVEPWRIHTAEAPTAPLAICRAALAALQPVTPPPAMRSSEEA